MTFGVALLISFPSVLNPKNAIVHFSGCQERHIFISKGGVTCTYANGNEEQPLGFVARICEK